MQCLELVQVLVTPLHVVLRMHLRETAKLVMVNVSAIQTVICMTTAVWISIVLHVIQ